MFVVVDDDGKNLKILDTEDGVIETYPKVKVVLLAKSINIMGVDGSNIKVTPLDGFIWTMFHVGDITTAIRCLPLYWEVELTCHKKIDFFLERHTYTFYSSNARGKKEWAREVDNRSKTHSSGYTDTEMVKWICDLYHRYGGFKEITVTKDDH